MIRNLKALGLALAAVFALSAAIAASASAETDAVITSDGPVTLDGTELGTGENYFESEGTKVECPGSDLTGHKIEVTPHEPIPGDGTASAITVTPVYTNCVSGGVATAVDMNGCDYDLQEFTTTGGVSGTYGFKVKITCPTVGGVKQKIRITTSPCNFLIGEQTITGFHMTNDPASGSTPDDLTLTGSASVSGTACGIPVVATQHQNVTMKGTDSNHNFTEVTLSHN